MKFLRICIKDAIIASSEDRVKNSWKYTRFSLIRDVRKSKGKLLSEREGLHSASMVPSWRYHVEDHSAHSNQSD